MFLKVKKLFSVAQKMVQLNIFKKGQNIRLKILHKPLPHNFVNFQRTKNHNTILKNTENFNGGLYNEKSSLIPFKWAKNEVKVFIKEKKPEKYRLNSFISILMTFRVIF